MTDSSEKKFNIRIQHIRQKDVRGVIACNLRWIPEHYHETFYYYCLNMGADVSYLAEDIDSGEIIAYNICIINPKFDLYMPNELGELCGHVISLVVSPDYRRMGIARKLMEKPIEMLKSIYPEISKFSLHVRPSNDKAIALYKSLGFTEHSVIPNYYGPDTTAEDYDPDHNPAEDEPAEDGLTMVLELKETEEEI